MLIIPFATSFFISLVTTPLVILLYRRHGWIDNPKTHRLDKVVHERAVPRGGGIPIFISLLSVLFFLPLDQHLKGILAGALVALVVGIIDDVFEEKIQPLPRLLANFISAGLVVAAGIGIAYINNPFGGIIGLDQPKFCFNLLGGSHCVWLLADLFALVWIVWTMNFVGWSGGVDGQMPGVVGISALILAFLSLRFSADIAQWPVIILAIITAGAYFGFLVWNFYPQKIMPGYGGKTLAGFMLAVLSILSTAKVATLMLVLAIPLIDACYLVVKRVVSGRLPTQGGKREHLHHRLMELGWGKRRISIFYWSITALFGIISLELNSQQKFYTIVSLFFAILGVILWLNYLSTYLKPPDQGSG